MLTLEKLSSRLKKTIEGALVIEPAEIGCRHPEPENLIWIMPA